MRPNIPIGENWRKKFDSSFIIVVLGIIFVVSQVIIAYLLHPIGAKKVLELQTSLSASFVRDTLKAWDDNGLIDDYRRHYLLDFFHPIWYSIFLMAVLSRLFTWYGIPRRYDFSLFFPLLAGLFDLFENFSHLFFIFHTDAITPVWVGLSGIAALLKWGLVAISGIMIIGIILGHDCIVTNHSR